MCLALALALIFLPLGGGVVGFSMGGQTGAWIGAGIGLLLALLLGGVPTAAYLVAEKKKYDRDWDRTA